jgi:hypothetical protein
VGAALGPKWIIDAQKHKIGITDAVSEAEWRSPSF